jgi:hypothetical protein
MTAGYVVRDAKRQEVDAEGEACGFDPDYYGALLEKAWEEAAFVFGFIEERGG